MSTTGDRSIGVTLDSEQPGGYSKYPWYAIRQNYADAIVAAGGLPIALPHDAALAADYLDRIDALVVTGGAFDVDPALYGDGDTARDGDAEGRSHRRRTGADQRGAGARHAGARHLRRRAASGGGARRHADPAHPRRDRRSRWNTSSPTRATNPAIPSRCASGTLLHRIVGASEMRVNSAHHQAVRDPGPHAVVNAIAPDQVIEGVEDARYRFCLGVQWHPEFFIDPGDRRIFDALIAACRA